MRNEGEWAGEQGQNSKASQEEPNGRVIGGTKEPGGKKGKNLVVLLMKPKRRDLAGANEDAT